MADICELAHTFTTRECEDKKVTIDKEQENGDMGYTEEAQDIFNYYYGEITNILNI